MEGRTKWQIQAERKRARKAQKPEAGVGLEWQIHRNCELCGKDYVANNYQDRRTRIKRWKGVEICAWCQFNIVKMVPRLVELGIVKLRKEHR